MNNRDELISIDHLFRAMREEDPYVAAPVPDWCSMELLLAATLPTANLMEVWPDQEGVESSL